MQRSPARLSLAVLLVGLLILAGCQRPPAPVETEATPDESPTPAAEADPETPEGDTVAAVTCAPVDRPPVQGGEHLIGDQEPPVPYSSTPPTSGWHSSGAFEIAIHGPEDPLSEPRQVSVLEAGGAVIAYRDLGDDDRRALEDLVRDRYDGRVSLTPYDKLEPGHVAMTGWGVLQRCDGVDLEAVSAFVEEHADEEPDTPGHQH